MSENELITITSVAVTALFLLGVPIFLVIGVWVVVVNSIVFIRCADLSGHWCMGCCG